jgi:hypothetical protein
MMSAVRGTTPDLRRDAVSRGVPSRELGGHPGIRSTIRGWRLSRRGRHTQSDLARDINAVVRAWINYYGPFTSPSCSGS